MTLPRAPLRAAFLLVALPIGSAVAAPPGDARPLTQPMRDVEVIYSVTRGGLRLQERSRWQVATGLQRVDGPGSAGSGSYMLSDPQAHAVAMVNDAKRQVMELTTPALPDDRSRYVRLGTLQVAGLSCTEWAVTLPVASPSAESTRLCLTDDGVLLRLASGLTERARAVKVTYAPAAAADFTFPRDYTHVEPAPDTALPAGDPP